MEEAALLEAARPRNLRERWSRGFTARQVLERLAPEAQEELRGAEGPEVLRERRAIDQVYRALVALATVGRVQRRQAGFWIELRSKGHRGAVVDLFKA